MSKLGIYIVEHDNSGNTKQYFLVVAEDAAGAQDLTVPRQEYDTTVHVGRLGDYEPGYGGHRMVTALTKGGIVMEARP
jgi:hypothetical protein